MRAFLAAVARATLLATRAAMHPAMWPLRHDPGRIEGWMTPGDIARARGIDRRDMAAALGIGPAPGHPRALAEIAAERGTTVAALAETIRALRPDPSGAGSGP